MKDQYSIGETEPCHGKSCPKIFAIVIPKEGLAGITWVWHRRYNFTLLPSQIIFCSRCHTKRWISTAVFHLPILPWVWKWQRSEGTFSHDTTQSVKQSHAKRTLNQVIICDCTSIKSTRTSLLMYGRFPWYATCLSAPTWRLPDLIFISLHAFIAPTTPFGRF